MNELLTCAIMLDSLTVAYVQIVILLIELQEVLNWSVCLCSNQNKHYNIGQKDEGT
jgi:hypothetical protein